MRGTRSRSGPTGPGPFVDQFAANARFVVAMAWIISGQGMKPKSPIVWLGYAP